MDQGWDGKCEKTKPSEEQKKRSVGKKRGRKGGSKAGITHTNNANTAVDPAKEGDRKRIRRLRVPTNPLSHNRAVAGRENQFHGGGKKTSNPQEDRNGERSETLDRSSSQLGYQNQFKEGEGKRGGKALTPVGLSKLTSREKPDHRSPSHETWTRRQYNTATKEGGKL